MNANTYSAECLMRMCSACDCENACACECHLECRDYEEFLTGDEADELRED